MPKKYIVKSERNGTYLTYATEDQKQNFSDVVYGFRPCDLSREVVEFSTKAEAERACDNALAHYDRSTIVPVILEVLTH